MSANSGTSGSTGPEAAPTRSPRWTSNRPLQVLDRNFVWVLLALVASLAAIAIPGFLIPQNLLNIGVAVSFLGCLVLAQAVVLISGNFDLSTEANMVLGAVLAGVMISPPTILGEGTPEQLNLGGLGYPTLVVIPVLLGVCTLVGLANGLLVVKLRMNNFMVTLGMSILLAGMSLVIGGGRQLTTIPDDFRFLGATQIPLAENLKFPISVLFLLAVLVVAHVVLTRTVFGRSLYGVGSNRRAARAAGINTGRIVVAAYVISGFLAGLGAWLLVGRLGASQPGISSGALFVSFAAAVVGGVSLFGGRGSVIGILGGLLLIGVITNALNIANIGGSYTQVAYGLIILSAVLVDGLRARRIRAE